MLVTGDLPLKMEQALLAREDIGKLDVFIAGHHGSESSTGEGLLAALRPDTVVISVGYNSYGHPTQEVLSRLEAAGCDVYRTDRDGAVTIRCA